MATEVEITESPVVQEGNPVKPVPSLSNEHRQKLDGIVQQMIKNKESDDNIRLVVEDFKKKYTASSSQSTTPTSPQPNGIPKYDINFKMPKQASESTAIPQLPAPKLEDVTKIQNKKLAAQNEITNLTVANGQNFVRNKLADEIANKNIQDRLSANLGQDATALKNIVIPSEVLRSERDQVMKNIPDEQVTEHLNNPQVQQKIAQQQVTALRNQGKDKDANKLESNIYLSQVDINDRNAQVVHDRAKKIANGEYGFVDGHVVKWLDTWEAIKHGYDERTKWYDLGHDLVWGSKEDNIKLLDNKIKEGAIDPDKPIPMPRGVGGTVGTFIGQEGLSTAKGLVPNLIPVVGQAASMALTGEEMAARALGEKTLWVYHDQIEKLKAANPNMPESEIKSKAYDMAIASGKNSGLWQGLTGAILAKGPKGLGKAASVWSETAQEAARTIPKSSLTTLQKVIKGSKEFIGEGIKTGIPMAGTAGAAKVGENLVDIGLGLDKRWDEGVADAMKGMLLLHGVFHSIRGLAKLGGNAIRSFGEGVDNIKVDFNEGTLNKKGVLNIKTLYQAFTNMKPEDVRQIGDNLVHDKLLSRYEADGIINDIEAHRLQDLQIPSHITETDQRIKISNKIDEHNQLKAQLKGEGGGGLHDAYAGIVKDKIKKVEEEIHILSQPPEEQVRILTNKAKELERQLAEDKTARAEGKAPKLEDRELVKRDLKEVNGQLKEVTDKVNSPEYKAEQIIKPHLDQIEGVPKDMAKQDPEGFLKFVAEQAQSPKEGFDEAGNKVTLGTHRETMINDYRIPEKLVDQAIEMFPAPKAEPKPESGISVIMPNETPKNETITIESKEPVVEEKRNKDYSKNAVNLESDINSKLQLSGSRYIKAVDRDGQAIKIRVSDHNANAKNESLEGRTISFISKNERNPKNPKIDTEWIINEDGEIVDWQGEPTGETIKDILKDFDVEYYFDDKGNKVYLKAPKDEGITTETNKSIPENKGAAKEQGTETSIPESTDATGQGGAEITAPVLEENSLSLPKIQADANDIITGKKVFQRFSPQEQRGFAESGRPNVEASILLAESERAGAADHAEPAAQENRIEQYAKENSIWTDNTSQVLTKKYGEPLASGEEAIVWYDQANGKVIKTQDTFQYENLQQKLDGIALHNSYFPEAPIKVLGFGRNAKGEFQVIVEQPFIQGEKLTPTEIHNYLESLGFKQNENGHYSNGEVIIEDVHTGNAIKDKDGNIIVIDPIMRLNTPEQGYGGQRITNNKISDYAVSQSSPEEVSLGKTSANSSQMGEGISQPEESTGARTKVQSENKNNQEVGELSLTGITHAEMDKVAKELGLDLYEGDPETRALWDKQAREKLSKDPEALNKLFTKLRNGDHPDKVETRMMALYMADLKAKYNKNPTPELLNDIKRARDIFNIAGREQAKAFVARKGVMPTEETLADYHLRDIEYNNNAKLTEQQEAQSTKEFTEITAAKEKYEAEMNRLKDENAKLLAEKELVKTRKQTTRKSTKTKEDFAAERKAIKEAISEKLRKSRGQANNIATAVADFTKITPDVLKLMKSYVEEGIIKLDDLVTKIKGDLEGDFEGIKDSDIRAMIAGEYNPKKQTRNQLAATLKDLRDEAMLTNKLEALERGETPKTEKAKVKRNQRIEELKEKIRQFEQRTQRTPEEQIATRKKRIENEIKQIEKAIADGNYETPKKKEPLKMDEETLAAYDKLIKLKADREARLIKQQQEAANNWQKAYKGTIEVLNTPRALMSSVDLSAPGRQALVASVSHPVIAGKAFVKMLQAAKSEKVFNRYFHELRESPDYKIMQDSKLGLNDPLDPKLSAKEEAFMSNLAQKIPLIGRTLKTKHGNVKGLDLVGGSERAYVMYLNKMRVDIFRKGMDAFLADGKTPENSPELYKALASHINNITGRGNVGGKLENAVPALNSLFFSPRLMASRINLLTNFANPLFYKNVPKEVRNMYFKDMAKFLGFGATLIGVAALSGAGVELDPRSSDFLKIKVGDTRYDLLGGFQQYVRTVAQIVSGQKKNLNTGKIKELDGKQAFGEDRADVGMRFFRGKLAPIPGTAVDLISGRDILGNKILWKFSGSGKKEKDLTDVLLNFTPLIGNDIMREIKDPSVKNLISIMASGLGFGVQDFADEKGGDGGGGGADIYYGAPKAPSAPKKPTRPKRPGE